MIAGRPCRYPTPVAWAPWPTPPTLPPTPGQCFLHLNKDLSKDLQWIHWLTVHFLRYSQYPSLWSVAGTTLTPSGSTSGSITGGLTSQFLRGSSVSYSGLTSSLPVSSPSSMYDPGLSEVGVGDAQFESSIARLTASWAPVAQSY